MLCDLQCYPATPDTIMGTRTRLQYCCIGEQSISESVLPATAARLATNCTLGHFVRSIVEVP
jgi:hypothetical protein